MSTHDKIQEEVNANYEVFVAKLSELIEQHPGKFALLRHREIINIFESIEAAVRFAVAEYPDGLFSVQKITRETVDQGFFSNAIALSAI